MTGNERKARRQEGMDAVKVRRWWEWVMVWGAWTVAGAISLLLLLRHEPWRDELHTWLVTRDLTVGQMWHEMRWEGHVMLWQLVLHPFARLGAPVWTLGAVSWAINWATLAWFAKKGPFGAVEKAVVMASATFLYVNPVISRCYVLVPPILFGLAALWGERDRRPVAFGGLVALLANTHLYLEGTAGLLFLTYARQCVFRREDGKGWRACRRQLAGLVIMLAGMAVAVAQVLPTLWDPSRGAGWHCGWAMDLCTFVLVGNGRAAWAAIPVLLGWLALELWRKERGVFQVFAGSLAYMVCFSVFLYSGNVLNRALLWHVVALWALWAAGKAVPAGRRAVLVAGLSLCVVRADLMKADWRFEFDAMPEACRWIAETYGPDAEVWLNGDDHPSSVAAAYLPNLRDWRTGEKTGRMSLAMSGYKGYREFAECRGEIFEREPWRESFLAMGFPGTEAGLKEEDVEGADGVEVVYRNPPSPFRNTGKLAVFRVWRHNGFLPERSSQDGEDGQARK